MRKSLHQIHVWASVLALSALGSSWNAQAGEAAAAAPPPPPRWNSTFTAGLTLTSGNSDTLTATALLGTEKKWDMNEAAFGIDGAYGEQDGDKNVEILHGFGQYNRLFNERLFGLIRVDALHDAIADVEYRVTISPGLGYYFIKTSTNFLRGEIGPGVVFEKVGGETDTYMTLRIAERYEHQLTKTAKLWQFAEYLPDVSDWQNFVINAEIGIDVAISTKWSLRTFIQNTYDNQPAPGRESNDFKLVAGTAYKF